MNYREFGDAYAQHQNGGNDVNFAGVILHGEHKDIVHELEKGREWGYKLGNFVLSHLRGTPIDRQRSADKVHEYIEWAGPWSQMVQEAVLAADIPETIAKNYITELSFHHISQALEPQWLALTGDESGLTDESRTDSQTQLALRTALFIPQRERAIERSTVEQTFQQGRGNSLAASHSGQITEVDATLGKLEFAKLEPNRKLVVVAAPPQFELLSRGLNIDNIILDLEAREVIGAQVKTALGRNREQVRKIEKKYDGRFVVLIDGVDDLGNARSHKVTKGYAIRAHPGLLSMHHLARTPAARIPLAQGFNERDRIAVLKRANESTRGIRFGVPTAGKRIGEKLSQHLAIPVSQH